MVREIRAKLRSYKNHIQAGNKRQDWELFQEAERVSNEEINFLEDIYAKTETIARLYDNFQQLPNSDLEEGYESDY